MGDKTKLDLIRNLIREAFDNDLITVSGYLHGIVDAIYEILCFKTDAEDKL